MMRSVKTCTLLALTAFALAAVPVGCSSSDADQPTAMPPATAGNVILGVALEGADARVEAVYPADGEVEILEAHEDEATLRWEPAAGLASGLYRVVAEAGGRTASVAVTRVR